MSDGRTRCYKDAVFLSPHKFVGGPGTPGVLVVRRELLRNRVPTVPGGGTVAYVNPTEHRYLADPAHREEGGTPAIVESIRAGLVFQLKQAVGADVIRAHEERLPAARGRRPGWRDPAIEILGNLDAERLSIVSFVVRRAGRALPAPQLRRRAAQRPLRHPVPRRLLVRRAVRAPAARHRPRALARVRAGDRRTAARGSSRAGCGSTSTTSSPRRSSTTSSRRSTWSPRDGWRLLPDYRFDPATGLWRHRARPVEPPLRLRQVSYDEDGGCATRGTPSGRRTASWRATWPRRGRCSPPPAARLPDGDRAALVSADFEHLRWFELPAACLAAPGVGSRRRGVRSPFPAT